MTEGFFCLLGVRNSTVNLMTEKCCGEPPCAKGSPPKHQAKNFIKISKYFKANAKNEIKAKLRIPLIHSNIHSF